MSTKLKTPENARSFVLTLAISEEGDSAVQVEELGTPNRTVATIPKGEFGVREGLRVGGNLVREFYRNKQRELVLTERAAVVKRKREERITERAGRALEAKLPPKVEPARIASEPTAPQTPDPQPGFTGDFGANGEASTPGFFDPHSEDLTIGIGQTVIHPEPTVGPDPPPARSAGSVAAAALRRKGFGDFTGGKK